MKAFLQGFEKFGWIEGRNVRIDVRWAGGSAERMREIVTEFVALKPDVIVAGGSPAVIALKRSTSTIPVVFVGVNEPLPIADIDCDLAGLRQAISHKIT